MRKLMIVAAIVVVCSVSSPSSAADCGPGQIETPDAKGCTGLGGLGVHALFEKGYEALTGNKLKHAEAFFREGFKRDIRDAKMRGLANYYLAEALRQQNASPAEAIKYYQEAARLLPSTKEANDATAKARALLAAAASPVKPAETGDRPTTVSFLWNGSWNGMVTAYQWGGINTEAAWAVGKATDHDLRQMCEDPNTRNSCFRELRARPPTEIFANCKDGIAWQKALPERYRLTELIAGTRPDNHRGQTTVSSWFRLLCPNVWSKEGR